MSPAAGVAICSATRTGLRTSQHGDLVDVEIGAQGRTTLLRDVAIRTSPDFRLEMHIDTDEANAAGLIHGGLGELARAHCSARMTHCRCAARAGDRRQEDR